MRKIGARPTAVGYGGGDGGSRRDPCASLGPAPDETEGLELRGSAGDGFGLQGLAVVGRCRWWSRGRPCRAQRSFRSATPDSAAVVSDKSSTQPVDASGVDRFGADYATGAG